MTDQVERGADWVSVVIDSPCGTVDDNNMGAYFGSLCGCIDEISEVLNNGQRQVDRAGLSRDVAPILSRNRSKKLGLIHTIQTRKDALINFGNDIRLEVEEEIVEVRRRLYRASYSYHIVLLDNHYIRYEGDAFIGETNTVYKPVYHAHFNARLPHFPAGCVTLASLFQTLIANLCPPDKRERADFWRFP